VGMGKKGINMNNIFDELFDPEDGSKRVT